VEPRHPFPIIRAWWTCIATFSTPVICRKYALSKSVLLDHYPQQGAKSLGIEDPDFLDGLIYFIKWFLGQNDAPSARDEIKVLDGQRPVEKSRMMRLTARQ